MLPHEKRQARNLPWPAGWRRAGSALFLLTALLGMALGRIPASAATLTGGAAVAPPGPVADPAPPFSLSEITISPRPSLFAPPPTGFGCGKLLVTSVTLTEDLTCEGDGPIIGAANVTINLNGHTISGSGTGYGITVGDHATGYWPGTVIRNGRIDGFPVGIYVERSTGTRLVNVTNSGGRIQALLGAGLAITGSRGRCVIEGLYVQDSALTVDHCTIHGDNGLNRGNGFSITSSRFIGGSLGVGQSDNGVITGSVLDDWSLSFYAESRGNKVHDNVFKNSETALWLGDTSVPTVVEHNSFRDNSVAVEGYYFSGIVKNNEFIRNATAGVYIRNAQGVTGAIAGNTFARNGRAPSGRTDPDGNPVQGDIHLGWKDDPKPITVSGNVGTRTTGWFIWAPHDSVIDGGGNHGAPCGPPPYEQHTPGGGPTVTINPAVTCS
ncbi:hypothetical protein Skr01_65540 [Sphaerisporangium krabiense]|nr:hypothetical protein Skr01_65540 [Sphaerisporangium krabiense]